MSESYRKQPFQFPDPRQTLPDGLLCIGGNLEPETLIEAYSIGVFPWPQEGYPLLWFSPVERGVIDFSEFHISKSMKRFMKKTNFRFTMNHRFSEVIKACAFQKRPDQEGTWILDPMIPAYNKLHELGYAHSFECWHGERLVGGMYGIYVNGVFSGESMFFRESNASKFCLIKAIEFLRKRGYEWMDIQMVTPSLAAFGGKYISRDEFLQRLKTASRQFEEKL